MTRLLVFLLSTVLLWSSCDCVQHARGIVLDKETLHPLEGVRVSKEQDTGMQLSSLPMTDADGIFQYNDISGGFPCPDLVLVFRRPGYKAKKADLESPGSNEAVVLLEKE